jgi:N utilization substance protein B
MSRKVARENAFKMIFEMAFQDEEASDIFAKFMELQEDKLDLDEEDEKYILAVLSGVKENLATIDEKIKLHLKDWSFERISKADLAILRLAIYEILYKDDIPTKVSINEAVEIAKSYSDDSSPSFVNGVLAEIIKEK